MGYWSNEPMSGDFPQDMKDIFREELIIEFGNKKVLNKMNKYYNQQNNMEENKIYDINDIDISTYEDYINEFNRWIKEYILLNEDAILKFVEHKVNFRGYNLSKNYIIPLSFLEWEIKLKKESRLSKYLLELLNNTDGGSEDRGYEEKENMYPNKLYSPYDFIKYYIDNWSDLISGDIHYSKISSNVDIIPTLGKNLINVK
ncbi:hypothetical protein DVV91_17225 [Clostridium botulinum]|uniref:hypothetical protein n=1 Tax=Clostridium botulinum TaxID=1491 RepID=UPI001967A5E8|nr:hypothetical protein [Clostridium botulinum]MBN1076064.1 hypothetical protein [Clostridium botulinum]